MSFFLVLKNQYSVMKIISFINDSIEKSLRPWKHWNANIKSIKSSETVAQKILSNDSEFAIGGRLVQTVPQSIFTIIIDEEQCSYSSKDSWMVSVLFFKLILNTNGTIFLVKRRSSHWQEKFRARWNNETFQKRNMAKNMGIKNVF